MDVIYRSPLWGRIIPIIVVAAVLVGIPPLFSFSKENTMSGLSSDEIRAELDQKMLLLQGIALFPVTDLVKPGNGTQGHLKVVVTAYSSTPWQTDSDPFITASGDYVRDGIIANNHLPFGTLVRMPEIYGDKIFVVKDRMNWRKGSDRVDVWLSSTFEAKRFGVKKTYIEILES